MLPAAERPRAIMEARAELARRPLYLDTETTGLDEQAQIIEICMLDADGAVLLESFVKPIRSIPADTIRIHGITDSMVRDAPGWPELWPQVQRVLAGQRVAVYNAAFDVRMMRQSHAAHRMMWGTDPAGFFCLMKPYARFYAEWNPRYGDYRWHSLQAATGRCRLPGRNSHRARADALLARELLLHIAAQPC